MKMKQFEELNFDRISGNSYYESYALYETEEGQEYLFKMVNGWGKGTCSVLYLGDARNQERYEKRAVSIMSQESKGEYARDARCLGRYLTKNEVLQIIDDNDWRECSCCGTYDKVYYLPEESPLLA